MRTQSERTYGSRLRNGYTMVAVLQAIPNYYTDQSELMPNSFLALLQAITAENAALATAEEDYRTATALRQKLFRKDPNSIINLLLPIKAAVLARYGKKSIEVEHINTAIAPLRSKAPAKRKATIPLAPPVAISQSQLSYGSMTLAFANLVAKLERFNNYDSTRPELTIAALKAQSLQAEVLSQAIDAAQQAYTRLQTKRVTNYALMSERADKIKAILLSVYGSKSAEYKAAAKLSV